MKTISRIFTIALSLLVLTSVQVFADDTKDERKAKDFDAIKISGAFDVKLIQGNTEKVVVSGEEKYIDDIKTEVVGNTLKVYLKPSVRNFNHSYEIIIYFKDLSMIQTSGAVDINGKGGLEFKNLEVFCSGATDIELEMKVGKLELDLSGASEVDLIGSAKYAKIEVSGASEFDAVEFKIVECHLELSGVSEADIYVSGSLDAEVSGASDLTYYGKADDVHIDKSGISDVKKGK